MAEQAACCLPFRALARDTTVRAATGSDLVAPLKTAPTRRTLAPDPAEIDGDVHVSPCFLAGTTWTGDPALAPSLSLRRDLMPVAVRNVSRKALGGTPSRVL
ncbi:hypothetical protein ACWD25_52855, partial [Streptomyces sp. NPDC002920]